MAAGPCEWSLVAQKRAPFLYEFVKEGHDWSGATFKMDVRTARGDTGTAKVALTTQTVGTEGISASYDPNYVDADTGAVLGATTILVQIDKATMSAWPLAADPADDVVYAYDLHVTPAGEPERVFFYGNFTVTPGVTNP